MFCSGMLGSESISLAVPGISCIKPIAPFGDTTVTLKPDSAAMILLTNAGLMPCLRAMARMISFIVNLGTGIRGRRTSGLNIFSVRGWNGSPDRSQAQKQSTRVGIFIKGCGGSEYTQAWCDSTALHGNSDTNKTHARPWGVPKPPPRCSCPCQILRDSAKPFALFGLALPPSFAFVVQADQLHQQLAFRHAFLDNEAQAQWWALAHRFCSFAFKRHFGLGESIARFNLLGCWEPGVVGIALAPGLSMGLLIVIATVPLCLGLALGLQFGILKMIFWVLAFHQWKIAIGAATTNHLFAVAVTGERGSHITNLR